MDGSNISILVPYKSDNGRRDRIWRWIRQRYEFFIPKAEICIGRYNEEPFCRSAAINAASKLAARNLFIIADADMAFEIGSIKYAINLLSHFAWTIPFNKRIILDKENTDNILNEDPSVNLSGNPFPACKSKERETGGIIIVPRKCFEQIKGFDERFKGWGGEDNAFRMAMDTLCGKHGWAEDGTAWHFYHDRQPSRRHDTPTYQANLALYKMYVQVHKNKKDMQALIGEIGKND